jgi:hypothetical protein
MSETPMPKTPTASETLCSFCGKSQSDALCMLKGPGAKSAICDECTVVAAQNVLDFLRRKR